MRHGERGRLAFWIFAGGLAALMVGSAAQALLDYPWAVASFEHLGYPPYLIVPLEIAKLLGVLAVVSNASTFLKHLASAVESAAWRLEARAEALEENPS